MSTSSPFWCETCSSVIGPPPSRLMSPIDETRRVRVRRAVRGGHRDDRADRVLGPVQPLRGVRDAVGDGSQVTQSGPSSGSCVPSARLPDHGRPVETAWCHAIVGAVSACVALSRRFDAAASRPGGGPIVVALRHGKARPDPERQRLAGRRGGRTPRRPHRSAAPRAAITTAGESATPSSSPDAGAGVAPRPPAVRRDATRPGGGARLGIAAGPIPTKAGAATPSRNQRSPPRATPRRVASSWTLLVRTGAAMSSRTPFTPTHPASSAATPAPSRRRAA